jgi:CRP-like cAMP-binding protein
LKKNGEVLVRCPLFEGLTLETIDTLLGCITPSYKTYQKSAWVLMEGEELTCIGVVLSGVLHTIHDDYWGNRTIVSRIEPGNLFGESFICGGIKESPVSIIAVETSEILLLDFNRILGICSSACAFHSRLIKNMISNLAQKNMGLMEKIEYITQRNTRSKLLSYLSNLAKRGRSAVIEIPFNRQELADYLSVERSALSAELCRMRDEGLLAFHKNKFQILRQNL